MASPSSKEVGGVVLAFGGFVFLVMAVKGTWGNVWGALLGHKAGSASGSGPAPSGHPGTSVPTGFRLPSGVIPSAPTSSGVNVAPLPGAQLV